MVFCFVQKFFFGQHKSQNIFFCRARREIFLQNLTLGYMTKTYYYFFFPPPKSEYFFQHHWESEYFFRNSPPPFKLNGRSLTIVHARPSNTQLASWTGCIRVHIKHINGTAFQQATSLLYILSSCWYLVAMQTFSPISVCRKQKLNKFGNNFNLFNPCTKWYILSVQIHPLSWLPYVTLWPRSYDNWISYICNQSLSSLKVRVRFPLLEGVLDIP